MREIPLRYERMSAQEAPETYLRIRIPGPQQNSYLLLYYYEYECHRLYQLILTPYKRALVVKPFGRAEV